MKKSKDYKEVLEKIIKSEEFEQVNECISPEDWDHLTLEEKELLGLIFVFQGEKELASGDVKAFASFRSAKTLCPDKIHFLCKQAAAFAKNSTTPFMLKNACKLFEKVISLDTECLQAWQGWANTLVSLGALHADAKYFCEALEKFSSVQERLSPADSQQVASFYHDLGLCWFYFGKVSGEPKDFNNALEQYKKASANGLETASFLGDYGNAHIELALLINQPELINEAVEMYWKSVKHSSNYFAGWYNLAVALTMLYTFNTQESTFIFAKECFQQATAIEPHNYLPWLKWAELLAIKGRGKRDVELLEECCKKYEAADVCEPNHPMVLSFWGEALILLGTWTENIDLLKNAAKKVVKSLEIQKDQPRAWYLYGIALNEMGKYFKEETFFRDASDKFRFGLRQAPQDPLLWYGLALSHFAIGQLQEDPAKVNESIQYFSKVIDCGGEAIAQCWIDWGVAFIKLASLTDEKRYLENAISKLEHGVSLQGNSPLHTMQQAEWLYHLGIAYEALGDYEDSSELFEKSLQVFCSCLELDPHFHAAYFNIACLYSRLGEITAEIEYFFEAKKYLLKTIECDREDDHAWNELGICFLHIAELIKDPYHLEACKEYYLEAEKSFHQAAALGNTSALYHMACLYSLAENYEPAMLFLEKADEHQSLPPVDDLLLDEWLENLRDTSYFKDFLAELESREC